MTLFRSAVIVAVAVCTSRRGYAQVTDPEVRTDNCVSSNGTAFEMCVTLPGVVEAFWNYNTDNMTLDMLFEREDNGWTALGFSEERGALSMAGSNVVFGCAPFVDATREGADYFLANRTVEGVNPEGNQGLLSYTVEQVNNICSVRFVRPLAPPMVGPNQDVSAGVSRLVVASGAPEMLARHTDRGASNVDLRPAQVTTPPPPAPATTATAAPATAVPSTPTPIGTGTPPPSPPPTQPPTGTATAISPTPGPGIVPTRAPGPAANMTGVPTPVTSAPEEGSRDAATSLSAHVALLLAVVVALATAATS